MKKTHALTICLISVTALLATNAIADDFAPPPWVRGSPLTTAAEWEFLTDANSHTGPDGNTVATVEGGFGTPTVSIYGGGLGVIPIWSLGDGDGQWAGAPTDTIFMGFEIGNWADTEPVKYMRIQVTYSGAIPSISSISAIHQTAPSVTVVPSGITPFSPTEILFEYEMYPNPFFEVFELTIPGGGSVDQIVVDTISMPEPATMSMLTLGGLAILRRPRRRTV
jgi:hypothetical protein